MLQLASPPTGYEWTQPEVCFDARNFPEFPESVLTWTYQKIDLKRDAFSDTASEYYDKELSEYAMRIRDALKNRLAKEGF